MARAEVEKLKAEGLDAIARREAAESSEAKYTPVPEQYIQEVSIPDPPPSEYGYEEYAYQRYKLPRPSDYGTSKTALGVTVVLAGAVFMSDAFRADGAPGAAPRANGYTAIRQRFGLQTPSCDVTACICSRDPGIPIC